MATYTRHQVVLLLAVVVAAALGIAIGHWRRAHPDLVDEIERFDQPASDISSTASPAPERDTRKRSVLVPPEPSTRRSESAVNVTSPVLNRRSSKYHSAPAHGDGAPTPPIDLNRASAPELMRLPGIGPSLAARIIAAREADGPFASVDDLRRVAGIGAARVARFRELVTVSP